jgi:phenylalanyl-tRNA synthetase beta chain
MWLRDYVQLPDDTTSIVDKLASIGFPVDELIERPLLTNVIVGRITKLEKHPNADRLQVCTIDVGSETMLTIATAATNVAQGQIVPVARIGAELAGGMRIAPRKMRGLDSEGMLCSAEELGLPGDWFEDGIMQLDASTPLGSDVVGMFGLTQAVLDVDVTPNRPDAMSIVGLARELAAAFGVALREPQTNVLYDLDATDDARVTIETVDCKRFVHQRVSGLRVRPAKAWMRIRLALAGQRPINNIVDVSNFVMLELGQPLHFFDFSRIAGGHLIVRDAKPDETFKTLDNVERTLNPSMIVIADAEGATSLAGVMGGLRSEVVPETTEVLIESAAWTGPRIRRTSAALRLRSEASSRFEKSLPVALADNGAARAARLLEQEGGSIRMPRAQGQAIRDMAPITLHAQDLERLLGFPVENAEIERALTALGFKVRGIREGYAVTAPTWRADILINEDLVEEVARMVGYDRVIDTPPTVTAQNINSDAFDREMELAVGLAALDYVEVLSLSLQPESVAKTWTDAGIAVPELVEISNPLSEDQRYMRFALAPSLMTFAARDRALRPYRIFELGRVFTQHEGEPGETTELTALHAGGDQAFTRLKRDVLALVRSLTGSDAEVTRGEYDGMHPGKTAELRIGEDVVAYVGIIDPRLAFAYELEPDTALATVFVTALPERTVPQYVQPSRFPAVDRDLAVIVPLAVLAGDLTAAVREEKLVRTARVFDEYRGRQIGEDHKSLAMRLALQSDEATLTDADADAAIARIVKTLGERFGAAIRS